jgi:hypothetical protein
MRWFTDRGRKKETPHEEGELWLQELAIQIAKSGAKGIKFLLACVPDADESRLRAALLGLSSVREKLTARSRAEVSTAAQGLLGDARPLIVAEAVDTLRHLGCTMAKDEVHRLVKHPSPYVVGSVLRFEAHNSPDGAVPLLERALTAKEPIVRQNAIDELDDLGYVPALPKIRRLVDDPDKDVRQAALTAVENLEALRREQKASG